MGLNLVPKGSRQEFRFDERRHACAILKLDFPSEWKDLLDCLNNFRQRRSHILQPEV